MSHAEHAARAVARAAWAPIKTGELTVVPANQASWADLRAIFGTSDYPGKCYCQRFKTLGLALEPGDPRGPATPAPRPDELR